MLKRRKKVDCSCSGHPRGRPKVSLGPCFGCSVRPAVKERQEGKRLARRLLSEVRGGRDPEDL